MTDNSATLTDRFPGAMNGSDAVMWDIERDPELRSTVVAIAVLDRAPEWDVDAIAQTLHRLPSAVTTRIFGAMLKHVDTVVTNVAGPDQPSFLAGAEVVKEYAFAPPAGAAMNVSLVSHVGTACIGIVTDTAAVPDDDVMLACLVEGFDDVLAVAGHPAVRTA